MKQVVSNSKMVWPASRLLPLLLLASIVLLTSCRHHSERKLTDWIPGTKSNEKLTITRDLAHLPGTTAGSILATPTQYEKQSLMVNGYVGGVELRDLPRDMSALVLLIHDPINQPAAPTYVPFVPEQLELGERLAPLPGELMVAADHLDRSTVNSEQCLNHYFKLKSAGSRMRALSNYLAGNQADDLAASANHFAAGLQTFAEGYQAIATITPAPTTPGPIDLEIKPSVPVAPASPSKFDIQINAAAELLQDMAERLIENRDALITGHYAVVPDGSPANSGFVLLSAGNLYEAAAWRNEGNHDLDKADLNRKLSLAYVAFGNGMNRLNNSSLSFGKATERRVHALSLSKMPAATEPAPPPQMLKCAIVGWNRQVLADAASRLQNLGNEVPIQVRGKVFYGNFREEMNQTWIAMETVQVDGLAINLDYDDNSSTSRNVSDVYRWVSTTAK